MILFMEALLAGIKRPVPYILANIAQDTVAGFAGELIKRQTQKRNNTSGQDQHILVVRHRSRASGGVLHRYWQAFLDGGKKIQCGWISDRFGLFWQVTPRILPQLLADPDRAKAKRVMEAMVGMVKIDVAGIEAAAAK